MRHLLPLRYIDEVSRIGSIRKAAHNLAITSSALNRRILAMEEELGVEIFERIPSGVRLSTAGEIVVDYARRQISDLERIKSQIADLSGVRRGHVSLACGQALLPFFLPSQISRYRLQHPAVGFSVKLSGRDNIHKALADYSADLALVFEPDLLPEFYPVHAVQQQVHALVHCDHPLADRSSIRLTDCLEWPLALPTRQNSIRLIMEKAFAARDQYLPIAIESDSYAFMQNYVLQEKAITFQIPIGLPADLAAYNQVSVPIDKKDLPVGNILLGQLRGRNLSVAAARFAEALVTALETSGDLLSSQHC